MNHVALVLYMLHIHSSLYKLIPDNAYHENHPALPYRTAQQPVIMHFTLRETAYEIAMKTTMNYP